MSVILNGKQLRDRVLERLKTKLESFDKKPTLVVILAGDDEASKIYVNNKKKTAEKLGKDRMSAQAVGGAVAHNPISIIIPCHRVVGSNGDLTGYAGGLDKKRALLKLEQETASMSK